MIVQHYLQLLRQYRGWIATFVVVAAALTALFSVVLLHLAPTYAAAASVVVIPTEAEFTFGRESAATGPRSTARGLTSTYIEYIHSRPVVEAALERIEGLGSALG